MTRYTYVMYWIENQNSKKKKIKRISVVIILTIPAQVFVYKLHTLVNWCQTMGIIN